MDKKTKLLSKKVARIRGLIQAIATLLTNIHIPNLLKGKIYQGKIKTVCVPGLNCYSCPAATGACPIGAFQAVIGSSRFKFSYYITGFFYSARCDTRKIYLWFFIARLAGFRIYFIKSPGKNFYHSPAETAKIPEIYNPHCFRYSSAIVCNELYRDGGSILL